MPNRKLSCRITAGILLASILLLAPACSTVPANAPEQRGGPHLVLVSFDGFRWDHAAMTDTPAMDRMAREGLKAEALQPAFPTFTFPNHYSIATGALPWRHGIVANDFPNDSGSDWYHLKERETVEDGRWYLAEPIWVTAEKAGMRTAAYYFVGTEADVGGIRPTRWRSFDPDVPGSERVLQVLDWLSEPVTTRPRLVTLYFEDVDSYGHWYGPEAEETREAIRRVDGYLGDLLDGITKLPHGREVYVILVSDHGMAYYRPGEPFVLDEWLDLDGTTIINSGPQAFVHIDGGDTGRARAMRDVINRNWACGAAYLPGELPPAWRAGESDRYPELFVQANDGCAVITSEAGRRKITAADHGWSPEMREMHGIFYATGPRIPAGARAGVAQVTDVHPMMLEILGLTAPGPTDGDPKSLATFLLPGDARADNMKTGQR